MATTKRRAPKASPQEVIELKALPEIQRSEDLTSALAMTLPMFGSMGMMVVMAISGNHSSRMILMFGLFIVAMLCVASLNIYRNRAQFRNPTTGGRREYLAYLAKMRQNTRKVEDMQEEFAQWFLPHPGDLPMILEEGTRVGEHEPVDEEFLLSRAGATNQPFILDYTKAEASVVAEADPAAESALVRFEGLYKGLDELPLGVNLPTIARLQIIGNSSAKARAVARSVLVQVAAFAKASDIRTAVLTSTDHWDEQDWVKWLPHAGSDRIFDSTGPARMIDIDPTNIVDPLPDGIADCPRFVSDQNGTELPHLVIVNDGATIPPDHPIITEDGVLGMTVVEIPANWESLTDTNIVRVQLGKGDNLELLQIGFEPVSGRSYGLSVIQAEAVIGRLATQALIQTDAVVPGSAVDASGEASTELVDLLRLGDVRDLGTDIAWRPRLERDRLRVPIGLTPEHKTVYLDIKESALNGMGPHGLTTGVTGSGKPGVLRILVLALAMAHSSEEFDSVPTDFKGGATPTGIAKMPHVPAVITNLGEDLTLVDRMEDALRGEMNRHQELLRIAGNFKNTHDYERARKNGRTELIPFPAFLVVADEFSELLAEKSDFVDMFNQIGRLGRSLGTHLLLSSQRLEEGRLRGLQEHLSYRIGLRTFSVQESCDIIGDSEAYELPVIPGIGYFKPDASSGFIRF